MNYTILSIIALVAEAILLAYVIAQVSIKKTAFSKKTLWYSVPVFVLVYYIYAVGYSFSNKLTPFFFMTLISSTLSSFVFKVELGYVTALAFENGWFFAAAVIALIYAGATMVASVVAITGAKMKNDIRVKKGIKEGKVFVVGTSDIAKQYAKNNDAILISRGTSNELKELIKKKFTVLGTAEYFGEKSETLKLMRKNAQSGAMLHFIAFADDIASHEALISSFIDNFSKLSDIGFTLHVEASLTEMDVINRKFIDKKTAPNICVKSFNKYELMARKFIVDAPIAKYLPENFYGDCRTIKEDKKINVVFLGFGKVNCEVLKLMAIQNQFVGLKDGKFANFPVNYYVYDNSEDRIFSDTILTLRSDMRRMIKHDLPLPEPVCNIAEVERFNVFSEELADKIHNLIIDENAFTYLIVSVGSDLENVATAERFVHTYYAVGDRLKVFARAKDNNIANSGDVICFGNERKILSHEVLINEALDTVSRATDDKYKQLSTAEIKQYNVKPTIEKYSNIYHAISLMHKMGMLGYTYMPKNEAEGKEIVTKEQLYKEFGAPDTSDDYKKYFDVNVWSMLGFSEHSRWEAQYILNGFKQMPLSEITFTGEGDNVSHSHKNIDARLHACITDYAGLDILHKYLAEQYALRGSKKDIRDLETYKYDYMLVSEGYDEMIDKGFVLVKLDK